MGVFRLLQHCYFWQVISRLRIQKKIAKTIFAHVPQTFAINSNVPDHTTVQSRAQSNSDAVSPRSSPNACFARKRYRVIKLLVIAWIKIRGETIILFLQITVTYNSQSFSLRIGFARPKHTSKYQLLFNLEHALST